MNLHDCTVISGDKSSRRANETNTIKERKNIVRSRWRWAYEALKSKNFFKEEDSEIEMRKSYSKTMSPSNFVAAKHTIGVMASNAIAQKFAKLLKIQLNSLTAKQYKILNDVCYADVAEDIKRRQKLKKNLENSFLTTVDKQTRKEFVSFFSIFSDLFFSEKVSKVAEDNEGCNWKA